MIAAKHAYYPFNKLSYFNNRKDCLRKQFNLRLITRNQKYLRFSFQFNAPFFLITNLILKKIKQ